MNEKNIAFIDGQNLYLGTKLNKEGSWSINLAKFRVYLREKYCVEKAYYYLGFLIEENQNLYEEIQSAGFILIFREHSSLMKGKKKGNVDSDIILDIMKKMYYQDIFDGIVMVSGDGDYKQIVDFLITENRFKKILFPSQKQASSLYKKIEGKFFASLDDIDVKKKIS